MMAIRRPLAPYPRGFAGFARPNRAPALARGKPVLSAQSGFSPRDALVEYELGLGLGQRIDASGFALRTHEFTGIEIAGPGRRVAGRSQRRWAGRLADVRQDRLDRRGVGYNSDDPHLARTVRTGQREYLIDARQQP